MHVAACKHIKNELPREVAPHPKIGDSSPTGSRLSSSRAGMVLPMDLVDELLRQLRHCGHVSRDIPDEEIATQWRAAARRAGRHLGRPVRTYCVGETVVAALKDWPANELEREITLTRMRNAIKRM